MDNHFSQPKNSFNHLIKISISIFFLILCHTLTFSVCMFYNLLLLPLVGALGYFFTQKRVLYSFGFSLALVILSTFEHTFYTTNAGGFFLNFIDAFVGLLIWGLAYFILLSVGTWIAHLSFTALTAFKLHSISPSRCVALLLFPLALTFCIGILTNVFMGNPISSIYAFNKMKTHLQATYPEETYALPQCTYNYNSKSYASTATMHTSEGPKNFMIYYTNGKVIETYYKDYIEDIPNSIRLSTEASAQLGSLLEAYNIPFDSVNATLSVPLSQYNQVAFNTTKVLEPIDVSIYKLTSTKESYEDFTLWCEQIRQLCVASDFNLQSITFISDPNFSLDRLSLKLTESLLELPITTVEQLSYFTDYGKENDYDKLSSQAYAEEKQNLLKNDPHYLLKAPMTPKIIKLLKPLDESITFIPTVHISNEGITINIIWSGEFITPSAFATQCLAIKSVLESTSEPLGNLPLLEINFSYYWGNSKDCYHYTFSDLAPAQLTSEAILLDLFMN